MYKLRKAQTRSAKCWRRKEAKGNVIILRYADDIVVGFQHEDDARRFWDAMRVRPEEFSLALHPDKTRLLEFGRNAAGRRKRYGLGRPETFTWVSSSSVGGLVVVSSSYRGRPEGIACGRNSGRSRRNFGGACMNRFQCKGNGSGRWFAGTSRTTRCPPIGGHSPHFDTTSPISGGARSGDAARRMP
jgi:hypothetical protein